MTIPTRLSLFYAAFFLAGGIQLPFWPVWLSSRGLGPTEVGALLAIGQWMKIATGPLIANLADRSADPRRVMVGLVGLCVAGYLLCIPAHGFAVLVLLNALVVCSLSATLPIGDSLALAHMRKGTADYGRVRLWGTLAFILATVAGGPLISGRGPDMILTLIVCLVALNLGSCALLPRAHTHLAEDSKGSWRAMLAGRNLLFLVTATLINASHAVYYAFGTLYWQQHGYSDTTIAFFWAEGAAAEAVFFFWGSKLVERWGSATLLALGGAAGVVRWTVLGLTTDFYVLIVVQLLHVGTFAMAHLGGMHYLSRAIPPRYAATGQAACAAIGGAGFGAFMLGAGWLYGVFGGKAYFGMAVLAGLAAILALILGRMLGKTDRTTKS